MDPNDPLLRNRRSSRLVARSPSSLRTPVLIAGGGPSGLMLAIELGSRGVPCMLAQEQAAAPTFPKANATTSRTMEHYRRLGFAPSIRALGLPPDYPQDIAYFTRLTGHELARVPWRPSGEAVRIREGAYSRWPTPEPLHRANQMYIEAVMRQQAARWPTVDLRLGWRFLDFVPTTSGVQARIEAVATGQIETVDADYLVGCEGARSRVRATLGIEYHGSSGETRDYLGGQMLAIYIRAPAFYDVVKANRAWQYWVVNRVRRGLITAIDGRSLFVVHVQLPAGFRASDAYARESVELIVGQNFAFELIGTAPWTAGFTLVAERFSDPRQRVFLAGDAAHLFTPTGGQGYNTSIDDAANIGWKLAAMCQGWGGPDLLATYETERRPVAVRNTTFARAMADSIGRIAVADNIEAVSAEAEQARNTLGARLVEHCVREFDIPGIHFGAFYGGSAIVCGESTPANVRAPTYPPTSALTDANADANAQNWSEYQPQAIPGGRAPHIWLSDDVAIYDCFGRGFTLLKLGHQPADSTALEVAAQARGVPLTVVTITDAAVRELYGADLVLVRPDQHVAWRNTPNVSNPSHMSNMSNMSHMFHDAPNADDPASVIARITGNVGARS